MAKTISVADARQNFARLIETAERGRVVEITRRGEPVAVLLSAARYSALSGEGKSFTTVVDDLRSRLGVERLGIGDADFAQLRDRSPGRAVAL
jgi:prevent-host-death family protein